jgi:hypothetical protein
MEPAIMDCTVHWILRFTDKEARILKALVQNAFYDNEADDVKATRKAIFEALLEVKL